MMSDFSRRYLRVRYPYENPLDRQRANGLLYTVLVLFAIWSLWVIAYAFSVLRGNPLIEFSQFALSGLLPLVVVGVFVTVQRGRLTAASWIFILWLTSSIGAAVTNGLTDVWVPFIFLPIVAAGLLVNWRGISIVSLLVSGTFVIGAYNQSQLTDNQLIVPADSATISLVILLSTLILMNAFFRAFGGSTQRIIADYLQIAARYRRLSNFAHNKDYEDEYQAYREAINLIRNEYGFIFAQVYLSDEDGRLARRVRAGSSDDRDVTVQVTVPQTSTLYETVQSREPIIVTLADAPTRREHLLPSVSRGVSLPIISGKELIGVLDVQTGEELFTRDDLELLQAVASRVGVVVGDVRRIISLKDTLKRQETMMEHLRTQGSSPGQISSRDAFSWNNYLQRNAAGFGFDIDGKQSTITAAADLSPELRAALESGEVVTINMDEHSLIVIPILLRGEVMGAMQFRASRLNNRQIEIAQKIAGRLAQALENRRLFEQSQAQANRERKASEVANQLISATEVNAVLDLAASTFNEALGAVQTRIHIKPDLIRESEATATQTYPQVEINEVIEKEGHDQ